MPFRKSCLTIRLPQVLPFIGQYIFWVGPYFTFRIIMPFRKSCLTIRLPQVLPFMIYLNISDVYETGTLKLSSLKWKKCLKRFRVTYTAHGKRQTQVANQSQNGKWADKNSPKQFFWVAMTLNYLFLCRGNNWKNSYTSIGGKLSHVALLPYWPWRIKVGRWNEHVRAKRCDAVDSGLFLEMSLVFDFGQGLRCGLSIRHCRCHWIMAASFVFLHFFLVPLCRYAVSERQMLLFLREV